MRVARLWALTVAAAVVAGCGGDDDPPTGPAVFTTLSVTPATPTIIIGVPLTLTALAKDQNGGNMSGLTVTYQSSDQTKATVTSAGVVTGLAAGPVTITATGTVGTVTKTATVNGTVAPVGPTASVAATADSRFEPQTVAITRQGTVTWTFAMLHNVTFGSGGAPTGGNIPDTGTGSVQRTFPNAGTFNYSCTIHPGMTGSVVVQ